MGAGGVVVDTVRGFDVARGEGGVEADRLGCVFRQPDGTGLVLLETGSGAEQGHADGARMTDPAELVDAAAATVRHREERGLVAEGVTPAVGAGAVETVDGAIDETLAGDVGDVGAGDG